MVVLLANSKEIQMPLWDMITRGGPVMIPLSVLFLISIYICIERLWAFKKANEVQKRFMEATHRYLEKSEKNMALMSFCKGLNGPQSAMIDQGIKRMGLSTAEMREAMNQRALLELEKLERHLSVLNITGRIAPMFGFIGTIIGVITIFYDISLAKTVEIEIISKGLYQKMITSAGGLVVGVFAFICYHILTARVDRMEQRLHEAQEEFLDLQSHQST